MGSIGKSFALILILIMAISSLCLIMVKPVNAQTIAEIPKPSVPQFALSFLNFSYTQGVNYIQNESIIVSISNQPFTPYTVDGHSIDLYYIIRWNTSSGPPFNDSVWPLASNCRPGSPNAPVTDVQIIFSGNNYTGIQTLGPVIPDVPVGGHVDFQVQALIGYYSGITLIGNSSDWSNTQTITIPESSKFTSSSPSPSPTVPEFPFWAIPFLLIMMVLADLLVRFKKHKYQK